MGELIFLVSQKSDSQVAALYTTFTSIKLCKCSKNLYSASRVASNSNKNQSPFA